MTETRDALIEAASEPGGLGPENYDAPMGRELRDRLNKPWIGEVKTNGGSRREEGGPREYRLYFSEPDIERLLRGTFLGHKTMTEMQERVGSTTVPRSSAKQWICSFFRRAMSQSLVTTPPFEPFTERCALIYVLAMESSCETRPLAAIFSKTRCQMRQRAQR